MSPLDRLLLRQQDLRNARDFGTPAAVAEAQAAVRLAARAAVRASRARRRQPRKL